MTPIDINPPARSRPTGAEAPRAIGDAAARTAAPSSGPAAPGVIGGTAALSAGEAAPRDAERVAQIRDALKEGRYPLVPTKVADAMIAAGFILIEGGKE